MPSREDQLAGWTDQGLHGTGHAKNKPLDDDPDFKQIGIAFVLASGIKAELIKEKEKGDMTISEDFDPEKHGVVTSAFLNDVEVEPRKRPSMIKRKVKPKKIYAREYKDIFKMKIDEKIARKLEQSHKTCVPTLLCVCVYSCTL